MRGYLLSSVSPLSMGAHIKLTLYMVPITTLCTRALNI